MANRRKSLFNGSGLLAALLIAGRNFNYTVCNSGKGSCRNRKLYYAYLGEECPHCGVAVTIHIRGQIPTRESLQRITGQ